MPIVTVSMYSGRTQREKDRLAEAMTAEDIAKILNIKKEEVIIVFQEAPHGNWYSSGVRL
jgi:4-oxalocrotonate tautomerase